MNLTFDIGNTAVKWAAFDGRTLVDEGLWSSGMSLPKAEFTLACASGEVPSELAKVPLLQSGQPIPINIGYKTPTTLGADRLADACGAWSLHRGSDCLIVDAGTCITVDFLSADGVFHGGAIMPGLAMKLQALHTFTAKLPLIKIADGAKAPVLGRTTEESIVAGTLGATMLALAGFVAAYREKCPQLKVLLTGGDAPHLLAAGTSGWQHCEGLSLIGLNEILMMNYAKANE